MKSILIGLSILALTLISFPETQAQSLDIRSVPVNNGSVLPNNGVRVPFLQLVLQTGAEATTIRSVTLSRSGLSSSEDVGRVWLVDDFGIRLTRARQFNNDNFLTLELNRGGLTIPAFSTEVWTVVANLEFQGSGRTIAINLEDVETGQSNRRFTQPSIRSFGRSTGRNFRLNSEITDVQPIRQTPTTTKRRFSYDKSKYRVKCRNSRCQLVLR